MATATSTTSRRNFLAVTAASAAILVPNVALPAASPDAELLTLESKLRTAFAAFKAAGAKNMAAYNNYEKIRPERPKTLLWQSGDPVSARAPVEIDGEKRRWCDFLELKRLSEDEQAFVYDQERADNLRGAYRWYASADEAAHELSGFAAAEKVLAAAMADLDDVYDAMLDHKPTTFEGVKALATGVLLAAWLGVIEVPDNDQADRGLAALVSALTGEPV